MAYAELKIKIASPEDILDWSYGEVTKPETINYRTQKPEKDGLFSEAIFGPTKDWECYCGKYRRIRYKGIVCDRCGVEVTRSIVRRERMGHIVLAAPVAHIWFLRAVPSRIAATLNISLPDLDKIIYFSSYIITRVNEELKVEAMKKIDSEFKAMIKNAPTESEQDRIKEQREKEKENIKSIKRLKVLSELEFRDLSIKYGEVFEVGIGAEAVRKILEEMNLNEEVKNIENDLKTMETAANRLKLVRRLKILKGMIASDIRPEWMIMTVLPIIPPALRPMVALDGGRYATSDLNDLYRRVINRNNRLKHLVELKAPEVITKNEKRMLQEAVDALIDNAMRSGQTLVAASTGQKRALKSLADMLKGKHGRFRQNLLGKRVDYSGRSVIVIGPWLPMNSCGLPKYMALELFKPFVINYLITKGFAHNIRSANHLIEQETPEVWEALDDAIKDKLVLLNRAPTLHRLSVQAFKPILIEGKAIKIPAMPTRAFNADFDGDQMAVHLPLTEEAQKEARELMLSTHGILKPATGEPVAIATRDITFGCYFLTSIAQGAKGEGRIFSSEYEAVMAHDFGLIDLRAKVKVKISKDVKDSDTNFIETSAGRVIFNQSMPDIFPFLNREMGQNELKTLEAEILDDYGEDIAVKFLDSIKDLGFKYATVSGVSWGMDDLKIPPEKAGIIDEAEKVIDNNRKLYEQGLLTEHERKSKAFEVWMVANAKLEKLVSQQFDRESAVALMVNSKARGNWGTVNQLTGMRGLMTRPDGQLIEWPVKSNFKEGLNVVEYFISTHGARKGLVDTALRTATAGYITRRLVDVAQDVVIKEANCKDTEGYTLHTNDNKITGEKLSRRILGRVILEDIKDDKGEVIIKKGTLIDKYLAPKVDELNIDKLKIRSILTCKAVDGICQTCYGYDLSKNKVVKMGEAVGIVTAQAIGEPGTQLTMRTFHTGGVASASDITMGLPRVEEIFEARTPAGKALVSDVDGKVTTVEEKNNQVLIKLISNDGEEREYLLPPKIPASVSAGDLVTAGTQLSDGHLDLKELFKVTGNIEEVARYIIREVYKVYQTTGDGLNDKHIELIIRQMFSRVKVVDPGETTLLPGNIVEKRKLIEENIKAKEAGKQEAKHEQLILGITKVSLTTESYLSSASFQETAHVLIDAAITGAVDTLRGLKENVIIGRLIPAGTGTKQ
ncbi:MAG: DNA-directed RNA polymerase subunit beta' [bacterium]|nr:DNA-directed RNA polymerase subunit beta' [bacterium]